MCNNDYNFFYNTHILQHLRFDDICSRFHIKHKCDEQPACQCTGCGYQGVNIDAPKITQIHNLSGIELATVADCGLSATENLLLVESRRQLSALQQSVNRWFLRAICWR